MKVCGLLEIKVEREEYHFLGRGYPLQIEGLAASFTLGVAELVSVEGRVYLGFEGASMFARGITS